MSSMSRRTSGSLRLREIEARQRAAGLSGTLQGTAIRAALMFLDREIALARAINFASSEVSRAPSAAGFLQAVSVSAGRAALDARLSVATSDVLRTRYRGRNESISRAIASASLVLLDRAIFEEVHRVRSADLLGLRPLPRSRPRNCSVSASILRCDVTTSASDSAELRAHRLLLQRLPLLLRVLAASSSRAAAALPALRRQPPSSAPARSTGRSSWLPA